MGQTKSINHKGIIIENLKKFEYSDEAINSQLKSTTKILEDFINYYTQNQKIHLDILERLLNSICIEEECLKRLKITLDEDKNEFFYNENLFMYNSISQSIKSQLNEKKTNSNSTLEDIFAEILAIFNFKRDLFFTYPFYFFCEFLKYSTMHIIILNFITINKQDIKYLYSKYYFLGFHLLLEGLLARISAITPNQQDFYSNHSKNLRNGHEVKILFFNDQFAKAKYATIVNNNSDNNENKGTEQKDALNDYRNKYINEILLSYGKTRIVQLINIFNLLSEAIKIDKIDYKEMKKQLLNEKEEYQNQIFIIIPQFLKSIEEVIFLKNTQKSEINEMKKEVNDKNLEKMFSRLEQIQREFNPMEMNSANNNNNGNETQDDTLSKVSHIFSNKHINIYQHYSKQLIMYDESGFKIRIQQSLQVLDEQIQECEETILSNKEYKKQYKSMLNQVIHKINIFNYLETNCILHSTIK